MNKPILDTQQTMIKAKLDALQQQLENKGIFRKTIPKGLYIHGPVGRGKTMLMDSFYNDVNKIPKTRVHFHSFMQSVHQQLKENPITAVAKQLSRSKLFCFDEFHVTDIADAMILGRLFKEMFHHGITLVATANQSPDMLYDKGLHRERFLPFIELLTSKVAICELDFNVDYRRVKLNKHRRYCTAQTNELNDIFAELAENTQPTAVQLSVHGHQLAIPHQANGVAWFKFNEICAQNYGAADYLKLAEHYHSFIISEIPNLTADNFNEANRFITLIDILYDQNKNLVIQAASIPDQIYKNEIFKRTASRLIEMTGG